MHAEDVCLNGLASSCRECTNQAGIRGETLGSARLTVQYTSIHIRGSPARALSQTLRGLIASQRLRCAGCRHRRREYQARGRLEASTGAARFGGRCGERREQRNCCRSTRACEWPPSARCQCLRTGLTGGAAWQCLGEACTNLDELSSQELLLLAEPVVSYDVVQHLGTGVSVLAVQRVDSARDFCCLRACHSRCQSPDAVNVSSWSTEQRLAFGTYGPICAAPHCVCAAYVGEC